MLIFMGSIIEGVAGNRDKLKTEPVLKRCLSPSDNWGKTWSVGKTTFV